MKHTINSEKLERKVNKNYEVHEAITKAFKHLEEHNITNKFDRSIVIQRCLKDAGFNIIRSRKTD